MTPAELDSLTIKDAARLVRSRELSPLELTQAVLQRIESLDSRVNAFITVTGAQAITEAREAEQSLSSGKPLKPLHGVPVSLKDLIDTRGVPTTAGSLILADRVPASDATITRRLREAGAILVGKTNMHEFAYGVTSANLHYGPVRNPWDLQRVAGGSSGGAAVSVALSMSLGSIGTDTGGSIRIPAALTGTIGLKPTYGRVSGAGVIPLADSFDTFGPITRTVEDAGLLLEVIAGPDDADARTLSTPEFRYTDQPDDVAGLRLGLPRGVFDRTDARIRTVIEAAIARLEELKVCLVEIDLENSGRYEEVFRTVAGREVFTFHEQYLARCPDRYAPDTRARIENGRGVTPQDYARARNVLVELGEDLRKSFDCADLLVMPAVPIPAPRVGVSSVVIDGSEESVLAALTHYTRLASITGVPAISVPCGLTVENLPVGLQFVGPAFSEGELLRVARVYEQATGGFAGRPRPGLLSEVRT